MKACRKWKTNLHRHFAAHNCESNCAAKCRWRFVLVCHKRSLAALLVSKESSLHALARNAEQAQCIPLWNALAATISVSIDSKGTRQDSSFRSAGGDQEWPSRRREAYADMPTHRWLHHAHDALPCLPSRSILDHDPFLRRLCIIAPRLGERHQVMTCTFSLSLFQKSDIVKNITFEV